jgi:hypothetical protein
MLRGPQFASCAGKSFLTIIKITKLRVPSSKHEAGELPPGFANFSYGPTTSITTQRAHLGRMHIHEWVAAADEGGWATSKTMADAMMKNNYMADRQTPEQQAGPQARVPFSNDQLVKHIVAFIVANDQVCLFLIVPSRA